MQRILARHIIYNGKMYPLSVAQLADDRRSVTIQPFVRETAMTAWVDGSVEIVADDRGLLGFKKRLINDKLHF